MFEFLTQHQFWAAVAIYWIYSAAVSSLPFPAEHGSPAYIWFYGFCHTLAGNLNTAFGNKIPGVKTLVLATIVPLMLVMPACAAMHYTPHPGALNVTDSAAYDTLLIAQAAIDQARTDAKTPKDALNTLIQSYNVARESWLTYRGAIATNVPAQAYYDQLNKNLTDLTNAIRAFKEAQ